MRRELAEGEADKTYFSTPVTELALIFQFFRRKMTGHLRTLIEKRRKEGAEVKKNGLWGLTPALLAVCLLLALAPTGEQTAPVSGGAQVAAQESVPLVALTFDDGPRTETTLRLLDGLALREIPATFFLVGSCIPGREDVVRRMAAEGHQIGVHTYDHVQVTQLSREEFWGQLNRTRDLLGDILGPGEFWLRPPYGIVNDSVRRWADGPLILWSVDPEDWKDRNAARIVSDVAAQVKDGDIILLHDIYPTSVEAALQIADALTGRGFCFVTVEQLLALRGVQPRAGELYTALPPEK